jgi:outer membrane protein assembly factor BamB
MSAGRYSWRVLVVVLLLGVAIVAAASYRSSLAPSSAKAAKPVLGLAASGWPSFRGDAQNTGLGGGSGAVGRVKWVFHTGGAIESTPVVGLDGTVYVWSCDGNLYALESASGAEKWRALTDKPSAIHYDTPSPAALDDGTVVIGASDGGVYAFGGASGDVRWRFQTDAEVRSSPGVGADGTLYIATWDEPRLSWWHRVSWWCRWRVSGKSPFSNGKLYALEADTGRELWHVDGLGLMQSSPAVGHDGTVYVGSSQRGVVAVDGKSGRVRWEALTSVQTPSVGPDGTVYVTGYETHVCALDSATGTQIWRADTGDTMLSPVAVGPNDLVYVGSSKGRLFAFDAATGTREWALQAGKDGATPMPVVSSDGTVYIHAFRDGAGRLLAVDGGSGAIDWQVPTGGGLGVAAAIAGDGTLYIGSWQGGLYAIE